MLAVTKWPPEALKTVRRHSWGESQHLYIGEQESLAIARGREGGASSLHTHTRKHNGFLVISGVVEIWSQHGLRSHLRAGGSYWSPAGEIHRLVFLQDAELYELYRALEGEIIDLADIDRIEPDWKPGEIEVTSRVRLRR